MTDYLPVCLRYQGDGQCVGQPQFPDDELLCMAGMPDILKCLDGDTVNPLRIGRPFWSNDGKHDDSCGEYQAPGPSIVLGAHASCVHAHARSFHP